MAATLEKQSGFALRPGVADPFDLKRRLSYCTDADTTRGMFFNGALSAVRSVGTQAAVEECLRAAEIRHFVDFFNYPVAAFLRMAWKATEIMGPGYGSAEAVFRRLGQQAVVDFLASGVGRTLLTVAGRNPRQLAVNVPVAYKAAVSYGERTVTWLADKACLISFRRDLMHPAYHQGVLTAALEALGAQEVQVSMRPAGPLDTDFDCRWK